MLNFFEVETYQLAIISVDIGRGFRITVQMEHYKQLSFE